MVKKQILSVGLLFASIVLAAVTVFQPFAALITVFLSVLCFSFSVIISPSLWIIGVGSLLALVFSWIFSGSLSAALFFMILFLPIGSALGLGFRREKGFNDVMAYSSLGSALIGVLALVVFIGEFSGGSFDGREVLMPIFQEAKSQMLGAFVTEDVALTSVFEYYGISAEQYVETIYWSIVYNIPTFYMGFMMGLSVIGYWCVKFIMKRTSVPVSFMGRFDGCRISYAGAIIYFISTLIYLFTSNTVFGIVISNFSNIMTYVFAYAGISLIAFFLEFKSFSPIVKWTILIVAFAVCLMPTGLLNLIALLGVVDAYWNIRERLNNSGI